MHGDEGEMEFDDLEIRVSSREMSLREAEVEIIIHFKSLAGHHSRVAIRTTVEHETALSLETTRENVWRRARELLLHATSLTQTPAAALIAHKANREKVQRGELTDDNIF